MRLAHFAPDFVAPAVANAQELIGMLKKVKEARCSTACVMDDVLLVILSHRLMAPGMGSKRMVESDSAYRPSAASSHP